MFGNIDTNVQAIGIQIPQHLTEEMSPKESGYMLIIPQHEPIKTRGRLSAVQLWSLESGAMAVMVRIIFSSQFPILFLLYLKFNLVDLFKGVRFACRKLC